MDPSARVDPVTEAADIIAEWPEFAKDFKDVEHFHSRLVLPHRVGQLRILRDDDGKRIMYTWTRLDEPVYTLAGPEHWRKDGKMLWLGDLCYDRGMSTKRVIQMVREDMVSNELADQDELIVFYRGYSGRYGYGKVRSKEMVQ